MYCNVIVGNAVRLLVIGIWNFQMSILRSAVIQMGLRISNSYSFVFHSYYLLSTSALFTSDCIKSIQH